MIFAPTRAQNTGIEGLQLHKLILMVVCAGELTAEQVGEPARADGGARGVQQLQRCAGRQPDQQRHARHHRQQRGRRLSTCRPQRSHRLLGPVPSSALQPPAEPRFVRPQIAVILCLPTIGDGLGIIRDMQSNTKESVVLRLFSYSYYKEFLFCASGACWE